MQLITAVQSGNLEEVKRVLDEGADVNEAGYEGMTPLIIAAIGGYADIVSALVDHIR